MSFRSPRLDGEPPSPVSFRTESYAGGTVFPAKSQEWGELNYALVGVAELVIEGVRYLSPPHYGIWLPPDTMHEAWTRHDVRYVTVYVARDLCFDLPPVPQTLSLSPLLKAILADFAVRDVGVPLMAEDYGWPRCWSTRYGWRSAAIAICRSPSMLCSDRCCLHCRRRQAIAARLKNGRG